MSPRTRWAGSRCVTAGSPPTCRCSRRRYPLGHQRRVPAGRPPTAPDAGSADAAGPPWMGPERPHTSPGRHAPGRTSEHQTAARPKRSGVAIRDRCPRVAAHRSPPRTRRPAVHPCRILVIREVGPDTPDGYARRGQPRRRVPDRGHRHAPRVIPCRPPDGPRVRSGRGWRPRSHHRQTLRRPRSRLRQLPVTHRWAPGS